MSVQLTALLLCCLGQRVHDMSLKPPLEIHDLPLAVSQSKLAFLASAEAPPVLSVLPKCSSEEESGLLIIGPEGGLYGGGGGGFEGGWCGSRWSWSMQATRGDSYDITPFCAHAVVRLCSSPRSTAATRIVHNL
uniref:Secreted protein n=1 Tax=Aegilops tauschii subsp. strangulata TaxID=200361 RepID=A0A453HA95_AEGTS